MNDATSNTAKHSCQREQTKHDPNVGCYGPAVELCEERDDGSLWVSNDEYGSRVNYCPFCGYKALNGRD